MKKIIRTAFLTALGLLPVSCMWEETIPRGEQGVPVEIVIDTRAPGDDTHPGSEYDRMVSSFRVLIYDNSGALKWNFSPLDTHDLDADDPDSSQENTLDILTGTYDFVFVANEGDLADELDALNPGSPMTTLRSMKFDRDAFDSDETPKNIPMVSHYPGVVVAADDDGIGSVAYADPFDEGNPKTVEAGESWSVPLERVGIRLQLAITLTASEYAAWTDKQLRIDSIPGRAFLLPGIDNAVAPWEAMESYPAAVAAEHDAEPGVITGNDTDGYTVTYDRIILPEVLFTPVDDGEKALVLSMMVGGRERRGKVSVNPNDGDGWGYTLPRNTFLDMTASIKDDGIVFTGITVIDWGRKNVYLTDRGVVLPDGGVPAPPGVLGVNARTGRLTLVGSVHYKNTPVATGDGTSGGAGISTKEFGLISDDAVYVAYFKWGSLIALNGGAKGGSFDRDDIGWAPKAYDVMKLVRDVSAETAPANKWAKIPSTSTWPTNNNHSAGLGDPCLEADKGTAMAKYMTPSGGANGWNSGEFGAGENIGWDDAPAGAGWVDMNGTNKLPANGAVASNGSGGEDWSMFLPAAGYRYNTDGNIDYQGTNGDYWSSTLKNDYEGYNIGFEKTLLSPSGSAEYTYAFGIRCVAEPPVPSLPKGIHASPGVIGYIAEGERMGELTLRGSSIFKGTLVETHSTFGDLEEVPVYISHFKFGSLVPLGGSDNINVEPFDAGDIIPVPSYNWLENLKTDIGSQTGADAWEYVPVSEPLEAEEQIVSTPASWANGLGDPCAYYFNGKYGGNWRTPIGNPWYGDRPGGAPFGTAAEYSWRNTPHPFGAKWISNAEPEYAAFPNHGAVAGDGAGIQDWSMYLPINGNWNRQGQYLAQSYSYGAYLASTAYDDKSPRLLLTSSSNVRPIISYSAVGTHYYTEAFAVRCVQACNPLASVTLTGNPAAESYPVGVPITITATPEGDTTGATFRWQISTDGGSSWTDLMVDGEVHTGLTYTGNLIPGRNFFRVIATKCGVETTSNTIRYAGDYYFHAAPGVIGIKHSDLMALRSGEEMPAGYKLTLRGSDAYNDLIDPETGRKYKFVSESPFGPLEQEPVYMVHYQFGSLVARVAGTQRQPNGRYFSAGDIVWVPDEYIGRSTYSSDQTDYGTGMAGMKNLITYYLGPDYSMNRAWAQIPYRNAPRPWTGGWQEDLTRGLGDPCVYADKGTATGNYMVPLGDPRWAHNLGNPFGTTSSNTGNTFWRDIPVRDDGTRGGILSLDGTIFLPMSGRVDGGSIFETFFDDPAGFYWAQTVSNLNGGDLILFTSTRLSPWSAQHYTYGHPVRCVREPVE